MFSIVLGTNNRKKGIELAELLAPFEIEVKTLADFEQKLTVEENGVTFLENARKKASEQACFLKTWVIGEDSGLCVDALKGEPGIFSARFALTAVNSSDNHSAVKTNLSVHQNSSDEENNRLLLEKLSGISFEKRTAHYTCAAAISDPSGQIRAEEEQYCCGRILFEPAGTGGFGYDPLFEIIEYHQTFGVLSPILKRTISHRGRTMRRLIPLLLEIASQ